MWIQRMHCIWVAQNIYLKTEKKLSPPYLIPCDIHEWIFISEIYVSAGHVLENKTKMKDENKANKEEVWGKHTCKAML